MCLARLGITVDDTDVVPTMRNKQDDMVGANKKEDMVLREILEFGIN